MNKVTNDIIYVGVNDRFLDLFEGQYKIPNGVSYNSYLILDEKIAVMDSVDIAFTDEWLDNLSAALNGKVPDYLIVQHMEPDHSANIVSFLQRYKEATVVASAKAFAMMKNFFGTDFSERRLVIGEGSTLSLGKHVLNFIAAPMVHWPEVIVTYDSFDKVLFSADGFGKFGALDVDEPWEDEARRYYIGIVGKYGAQVQNLLKKAAKLDIEMICPLHGPVLKNNLAHYIGLYDTWSSYKPEEQGTVIAYTSIYGNTARAAKELYKELSENSEKPVVIYDLARCDKAEAIAAAFRYDTLVLASPTYNADIFPAMRGYIEGLTERGFCNRRVALVENGSWAPMASKVMRGMLENSKNLTYTEAEVKILSALNDESLSVLHALAKEIG